MTEKNALLLSLIENEVPTKEICEKLNISLNQLRLRLDSIRNAGFNIDKRYNYDGTVNYFLNKEFLSEIDSNNATIYLDGQKKFRMLAIADTHYGHRRSNMDYVNKIYDYCTKNDIHIVVHCGDLLDGTFNSELTYKDKLFNFLKDYPVNSGILTFVALGNHEDGLLKDYGYNANTIINKNRNDLVSLGYDRSQISVADNKIFISHEGNFSEEYGLKLKGHSHRYKFSVESSGPVITVPTLSDYLHTNDYPGAVDLSISIDKRKQFNNLEVKHLTINKGDVKELSTVEYPFKRMQRVRKYR